MYTFLINFISFRLIYMSRSWAKTHSARRLLKISWGEVDHRVRLSATRRKQGT